MDTTFYLQALKEFMDAHPDKGTLKFHDLNLKDISVILTRAQELKDTQETPRGTCLLCGKKDLIEPCTNPDGHIYY
jgi:hypothetical protein